MIQTVTPCRYEKTRARSGGSGLLGVQGTYREALRSPALFSARDVWLPGRLQEEPPQARIQGITGCTAGILWGYPVESRAIRNGRRGSVTPGPCLSGGSLICLPSRSTSVRGRITLSVIQLHWSKRGVSPLQKGIQSVQKNVMTRGTGLLSGTQIRVHS